MSLPTEYDFKDFYQAISFYSEILKVSNITLTIKKDITNNILYVNGNHLYLDNIENEDYYRHCAKMLYLICKEFTTISTYITPGHVFLETETLRTLKKFEPPPNSINFILS